LVELISGGGGWSKVTLMVTQNWSTTSSKKRKVGVALTQEPVEWIGLAMQHHWERQGAIHAWSQPLLSSPEGASVQVALDSRDCIEHGLTSISNQQSVTFHPQMSPAISISRPTWIKLNALV
jgi:hypothetical protein